MRASGIDSSVIDREAREILAIAASGRWTCSTVSDWLGASDDAFRVALSYWCACARQLPKTAPYPYVAAEALAMLENDEVVS